MRDFLIRLTSYFKFWNTMLVAALAVCVTAIAVRQGLKPWLSADVRFVLKQVHIYAGIIMVVCAFFHGTGRSGILRRKKTPEMK